MSGQPGKRRGGRGGEDDAPAEASFRDAPTRQPVLPGEALPALAKHRKQLDAQARDAASAEPAERPLDLLIARIGTELFGFPVAGVEEIVEIGELRALSEGDASLAGLCMVRGRLMPVYCASGLLGELSEQRVELALVLRAGQRRVGIAVDDAEEVIGVSAPELRRPPARGIDDRLVKGVVLYQERLLTLLDTEALVARFADAPGAET